MYPNSQRHGSNDPSRGFGGLPPPPPPMSPPMQAPNGMGSMMGHMPPPPPPGPPRYIPGQGGMASGMLPGPPPVNQQPQWQFGASYNNRGGYIPPPPPPNQVQPYNVQYSTYGGSQAPPPPPPPGGHTYNPQLHQMAAGSTNTYPNMTATYVPSGDSYGDVPGMQGLGSGESATTLTSQTSWLLPQSGTETNFTIPDDVATKASGHGKNEGSPAPGSSIPPEIAAQWPLDAVLLWMARNQFTKEWQETFKALNIHGGQFLEIGTQQGSRGTASLMHIHVYPRLKQACHERGTTWDKEVERDVGKRLRRLVRGVVSGQPVDIPKTSHGRKESVSGAQQATGATSAGTDPSESPNVSFPLRDILNLSTDVTRRLSILLAKALPIGGTPAQGQLPWATTPYPPSQITVVCLGNSTQTAPDEVPIPMTRVTGVISAAQLRQTVPMAAPTRNMPLTPQRRQHQFCLRRRTKANSSTTQETALTRLPPMLLVWGLWHLVRLTLTISCDRDTLRSSLATGLLGLSRLIRPVITRAYLGCSGKERSRRKTGRFTRLTIPSHL